MMGKIFPMGKKVLPSDFLGAQIKKLYLKRISVKKLI